MQRVVWGLVDLQVDSLLVEPWAVRVLAELQADSLLVELRAARVLPWLHVVWGLVSQRVVRVLVGMQAVQALLRELVPEGVVEPVAAVPVAARPDQSASSGFRQPASQWCSHRCRSCPGWRTGRR